MPSFSFAPISKPVKSKTTSTPNSKYNIIDANVEGIVCITLRGEYKVLIGDVKYDIASEDYSCQGVAEIYEQVLTNDLVRTRHIRPENDRADRDRTMYLPFTAGCSVKGNVVKHIAAGVLLFKIKKVFVDVNNNIAKQAIKFYRDNYVVIKLAIGSNFIDNYVAKPDQEIIPDISQVPELEFNTKDGFGRYTVDNVD